MINKSEIKRNESNPEREEFKENIFGKEINPEQTKTKNEKEFAPPFHKIESGPRPTQAPETSELIKSTNPLNYLECIAKEKGVIYALMVAEEMANQTGRYDILDQAHDRFAEQEHSSD